MNKAFVPITGLFFALIIVTTPTRQLGGFFIDYGGKMSKICLISGRQNTPLTTAEKDLISEFLWQVIISGRAQTFWVGNKTELDSFCTQLLRQLKCENRHIRIELALPHTPKYKPQYIWDHYLYDRIFCFNELNKNPALWASFQTYLHYYAGIIVTNKHYIKRSESQNKIVFKTYTLKLPSPFTYLFLKKQ